MLMVTLRKRGVVSREQESQEGGECCYYVYRTNRQRVLELSRVETWGGTSYEHERFLPAPISHNPSIICQTHG